MADYKVKCTMCGKTFLSQNKHAKYCSPLCRVDGAKQTRKMWEQSSRYKEKQNDRMREKRQEEQLAVQAKRNAQRSKRGAIAEKEESERKKKRDQELHRQAEKGKLSARQTLALERGDTLEYWRSYKERILLSEKKFNRTGVHLVGGIDIHEEHFEYLVDAQLK